MNIANRPQFTEAEIMAIAKEHYGLETEEIKIFESERDQNSLLKTPKGNFVLKISHPAEDPEVLDFQNQTFQLLEDAQLTHFPKLIPTLIGEAILNHKGTKYNYHIRLVSFLEGKALGTALKTDDNKYDLGQALGNLDATLFNFKHTAMTRYFYWDSKHVDKTIAENLNYIQDPERKAIVQYFLKLFMEQNFSKLRSSVIHTDANDYNVIVDKHDFSFKGLIDFGDSVYSYTVMELANACAYMMMGESDPLTTIKPLIEGYHATFPLEETEINALYSFIAIRLCLSVSNSAKQALEDPDNSAYLTISEAPAWRLLEQLIDMHPRVGIYSLRHHFGLEPSPYFSSIAQEIKENKSRFIFPIDCDTDKAIALDLSLSSPDFRDCDWDDRKKFGLRIFEFMSKYDAPCAVGGYNEDRLVYTMDYFGEAERFERRTVHLGLDIWAFAGTPVVAVYESKVFSVANHPEHLDYGGVVILEHVLEGKVFYTLNGHLSPTSIEHLSVGQTIAKGESFATLGTVEENVGWPPHLHFQIICDLLDNDDTFQGVAYPSQRDIWCSISPDPNLMFNLAVLNETTTQSPRSSTEELLKRREQSLGKMLSVSYETPLKMVYGRQQYLYSDTAQKYLDCVNNVCHVGHTHPKVVAAAQTQMALLNTNTRYLHDNIIDYAERLTATLPESLSVCFFVNSGSEANDLALRLARIHTAKEDMLVVDHAYHGHTAKLIEISPYKFDGKGGAGAPAKTHVVPMPDGIRGKYRYGEADLGSSYAKEVQEIINSVNSGIAGFITESIMSCGGQVQFPENYLSEVFDYVRDAGGVCIADEVQVGFGRVGTHMWAFETQNVVPDIVTMGKPIGNGHPLAAVITTPEIAASFHNGMEYFNTFGGNPVSCAVGLAVLDILEQEGLQQHALELGSYFKAELESLKTKHEIIGDVRGQGLFLGIEFIRNKETLEAADSEASLIVNALKQEGILLSTDGPLYNVIKIKPPMTFNRANVDYVIHHLDKVLGAFS